MRVCVHAHGHAMALPRPPVNREALRLYREVLRTARAFFWNNEHGEPWYAAGGCAHVWV